MHIQRIKKIFENLDLKIVYMKFLVSISDLLKKNTFGLNEEKME